MLMLLRRNFAGRKETRRWRQCGDDEQNRGEKAMRLGKLILRKDRESLPFWCKCDLRFDVRRGDSVFLCCAIRAVLCPCGAARCVDAWSNFSLRVRYTSPPGLENKNSRQDAGASLQTGTAGSRGESPCGPIQWRPDQSSARRMELLGLDGSYLTLAVWPAATRPRCLASSRPVMSCAVS